MNATMQRYARTAPAPTNAIRYTWCSKRRHPERFGQACDVVSWGDGGRRVRVRFADGMEAETSSFALRKLRSQ